jgi:hypothetical protein
MHYIIFGNMLNKIIYSPVDVFSNMLKKYSLLFSMEFLYADGKIYFSCRCIGDMVFVLCMLFLLLLQIQELSTEEKKLQPKKIVLNKQKSHTPYHEIVTNNCTYSHVHQCVM